MARPIWKDIEGFPGYQVSSNGKVRSSINNRYGPKSDGSWKELKPVYNRYGYPYVRLGRGSRKLISRLVAQAFIPNPDNYPIVRHMDDNPHNNRVSNLAWGTQTDNMQDCVRHGRLVGDTRNAIEARKHSVYARKRDETEELYFPSYTEAGKRLGIPYTHIGDVVHGKLKQTHGWCFRSGEVEHG